MSGLDSIKRDLEFCDKHRELADLLLEHGCAPAGEDRDLLRALVLRDATRELTPAQRRRGEREAFEEFRREQGLPPMNP